MPTKRHEAELWSAAFIVAAVLAATPWLLPVDRALTTWLSPLGRNVPDLNLIWIIGSVPVTGVLVLWVAWARKRWRLLFLFLVGVSLEVLSKHLIATALPQPVPEPLWIQDIEGWVNPSPHILLASLARWLSLRTSAASGPGFFQGSFFSGHVFRLTYLAGIISGSQGRWVTWFVALASGVLVVALGGHWALDVMGGFCLSRAFLAALNQTTMRR